MIEGPLKDRRLKPGDARQRLARGATTKPRATVRDVLGRDPNARVIAGHRGLIRLPDYTPEYPID